LLYNIVFTDHKQWKFSYFFQVKAYVNNYHRFPEYKALSLLLYETLLKEGFKFVLTELFENPKGLAEVILEGEFVSMVEELEKLGIIFSPMNGKGAE
jgi:hypothetical protein